MQGMKGLALLVLVGLGVLLMMVAAADEAAGATITVPDDYPTINSAIENATDYDTLFIKDGEYRESVVVWKPLTIMGESQDGTVIESDDPFAMLIVAHKTQVSNMTLQGTTTGAGFILQSSACVIEDVTVTDSLWGLWVNRGHNNIVRNVRCVDNQWQGLLVEEADHTLVDNVTCSGNNEGINVRAAIGTTVKDCTMVDNRVHGFLGQRLVGFYDNGALDLLNCVMSNNLGSGCEIDYFDGVTIEGCTVEDNAAHGIHVRTGNDTVIRGCTVRNYLRFGIAFSGSWNERGILIEDNILEDANTSWSDIMVRYVSDCRIINNKVTCLGGAISVAASNDTLLSGNVLISTEHEPSYIVPGLIVARGNQGQGLPSTNVTIEDCVVRGFAYGFSVRGGKDITIRNCTVTDAMVGIYCEELGWGDVPFEGGSIIDCEFDGCGLDIEGMIDVTVEGNLIMGAEVGVFINATTSEVNANLFVNNIIRDCSGYGVLMNSTNGTNSFVYNSFINNTEHASQQTNGDRYDNGKYGNYWDDYEVKYPDATIVGVVWDTPYVIYELGPVIFAKDEFPLAYPYDTKDPVADAGDDRSVEAGEVVILDGSGSMDDQAIMNYTWSFTYDFSLHVVLYGQVVDFTFISIGAYGVQLTVRDAWGNDDSDNMTVEVDDEESPVADAGEDIEVGMGEEFILDATLSTDSGWIVSYKWTVDPDGMEMVMEGDIVTLSIDEPGVYTVLLGIRDEAGNMGNDELTLTVLDTMAPVADAGRDFAVGQGTEVTMYGRWSSDNVGVDSWTWIFYEDGEAVILVGEMATHTFAFAGEYAITLNVTDAAGNWDTDQLSVTIWDTEVPTAIAGEDMEVDQWEKVTFNASSSSDNVGIVEYIWTMAEGTFIARMLGPEPEYVFGASGTYGIELEVWDAAGNVNFDTIRVTVNPVPVDRLWRLGPFKDDERLLGGVRVALEINGSIFVGYTQDDGWVEYTLLMDDLVSPASVMAEKEGWEDLGFTLEIDSNGDPVGTIPVMKQEKGGDGDDDDDEDEDEETDWLAWGLVIVLMVAFAGTLLYLSNAAERAEED